jgi:sporulation protein YlmC with PRC-barrel domain
MMMFRSTAIRGVLTAGFIVLLLAPLFAPAPAQVAPAPRQFHPVKLDRLVGMTVENTDGQKLGKVRDFVIDMRSGRLKFALFASGGFLGVGSRFRVVPPQILSAGTTKRDTIAIDTSRDHWNHAPQFKTSQLAALNDPAHDQQIREFYNVHDSRMAGAGRTGTSGTLLTATGRNGSARADGPADVKLASDLIGRTMVDRDAEKLGEVLDILAAFDAETPVFVIFTAGTLFRDHHHVYTVPVRQLRFDAKGRLLLDANRAALEEARPFGPGAWETADIGSAPAVYRYPGDRR